MESRLGHSDFTESVLIENENVGNYEMKSPLAKSVRYSCGDFGNLNIHGDHNVARYKARKDNQLQEVEIQFKGEKNNQQDSEMDEQCMVKSPEGKEKRIAEQLEGEKNNDG